MTDAAHGSEGRSTPTVWDSTPTQGGWLFTEEQSAGQIIIEFIHPTHRGLEAWVELRIDGHEIPIAEGNRDLMSPTAVDPFLKPALRVKGPSWDRGLRQAFHQVVEWHRDGATTQDLVTIEPSPMQFLLDPLIETGGATRLIAAGGSGKSIFALAAAVTVATGRRVLQLEPAETGPVIYLDWETNADTHARRLDALLKPFDAARPDRELLLYRFESVPLFRSAPAVRRVCDRFGVKLLIVDSAKMAAGPSGSGSSAEDSTLNLYLALREIGRPALIIDHKTKDDIAKGRRGGYGSVFYENLARMQWEMTKLVDLSFTERSFVLELAKENNVGRVAPLGFRMTTEGTSEGIESAQFVNVDPNELPDPNIDDLPDRIAALLEGTAEPLSVSRIGELLFGKEEGRQRKGSIRARLNQDARFENVSQTNVGAWRMAGDNRATGEQHELTEWEGDVF